MTESLVDKPWNVNINIARRVDLQGAHNEAPRSAYLAGYNDGWYGYPRWASNMPTFHPAAYSDGFASGRQDGQGDTNVVLF